MNIWEKKVVLVAVDKVKIENQEEMYSRIQNILSIIEIKHGPRLEFWITNFGLLSLLVVKACREAQKTNRNISVYFVPLEKNFSVRKTQLEYVDHIKIPDFEVLNGHKWGNWSAYNFAATVWALKEAKVAITYFKDYNSLMWVLLNDDHNIDKIVLGGKNV